VGGKTKGVEEGSELMDNWSWARERSLYARFFPLFGKELARWLLGYL